MKPTLLAKVFSAVLLSASALIAHAVPVVIFNNPTYVDTGTTTSSATDLQAALAVNNTVTTFSSTDAAAITAALQGQQVLVIPEQAFAPLAPDLSPEAQTAIRNYVANGGGLIITADYQGFLNTIFGYNLQFGISNDPSTLNAAAATGTAFAGGPATLAANNSTGGFLTASLPATGANSIYNDLTTDPANPLSTVTLFTYGSGEIVHLGYDFFDAKPLGSQDGGWLTVLNNAVAEVSGTPTTPGGGGNTGGGNNGGGNNGGGNNGGGNNGGGNGGGNGKAPEPGSLALMAIACGAFSLARRRRG